MHKHYKSLQFHQKLNLLLLHRTSLFFCHKRHWITTYTSKTIIKMCKHVTGLRSQYKAPRKVHRKSAHKYFFNNLALKKYYLKRHLLLSYSVCPGLVGLYYPYYITATWLSLQIILLFWKKRLRVAGTQSFSTIYKNRILWRPSAHILKAYSASPQILFPTPTTLQIKASTYIHTHTDSTHVTLFYTQIFLNSNATTWQ